jgi:hypothetical protein
MPDQRQEPREDDPIDPIQAEGSVSEREAADDAGPEGAEEPMTEDESEGNVP